MLVISYLQHILLTRDHLQYWLRVDVQSFRVLFSELVIQQQVLQKVQGSEQGVEVYFAVEDRSAAGQNFSGLGVQRWQQA